VTKHDANSADITFDNSITITADGTYNFTAYPIDVPLYSPSSGDSSYAGPIVIDETNNRLDYLENGSSEKNITLTNGTYSRVSLYEHIATRMTAASSLSVTYDVEPNDGDPSFCALISDGTALTLKFASGYYSAYNCSAAMGLECLDYVAATSTKPGLSQLMIEPVYAESAMMRITRPILTYRESSMYGQAAKEASKIFLTDPNSFTREFPLSRMTQGMPTRCCIQEHDRHGHITLRFDSVPSEYARIEVYYIPVVQTLQDNSASYPKIPTPYTNFLIYGAAYFIMLDNSDSRAQQYFTMAQRELKAMVNDSRKHLSLGGQNYGRLIPRANVSRYYGWKG
jgi:hypothetical protein